MQYQVENKAGLCPVCKGSGIYKEIIGENKMWRARTERTCHGCGGKGWVIFPTISSTVTGG